MRFVLPILFVAILAEHAIAGGSAAADHVPGETATLERIAAVALAVLLVFGLARLRRRN